MLLELSSKAFTTDSVLIERTGTCKNSVTLTDFVTAVKSPQEWGLTEADISITKEALLTFVLTLLQHGDVCLKHTVISVFM